MNENDEVICPWCDTEIVWDIELGPEEECPHCLNELGDYRSIALPLAEKPIALNISSALGNEAVPLGETDIHFDTIFDFPEENEAELILEDDAYVAKSQAIVDEQEDAPECTHCREYMLLSGTQVVDSTNFKVIQPSLLQQPFLSLPFYINVFICPSCFKVETFLDESSQLRMIDTITNARAND